MEKTNFEKENDKNDIALFRFAIIAPLINNSCEYKSKEEKYPYITGKAIYNKLIEDGDILAKNVSLASLYRFLNSHNFHTLKQAIKTYGVPKRIFVDNGTPYKNKQLSLICASIGAVLLHAKAYSPQSKAKIERSFRTVKDNFLNCEDWTKYKSLDELNESYRKYITS